MKGTPAGRTFERRLGRLLIAVTWIAVVLLAVGVTIMLIRGTSPLAGGPSFDPERLLDDLAALDPAGFLWLGLVAVLLTPISRVIGAAIGFVRSAEPLMAVVSGSILVVIAIGLAAALGAG
jgi:uncharacterized membrane protein